MKRISRSPIARILILRMLISPYHQAVSFFAKISRFRADPGIAL